MLTRLLLLTTYLTIRFALSSKEDALNEYTSYIFEAIFVLAVGICFRRQPGRIKFRKELIYMAPVAAIFGASIFLIASHFFFFPFDLKSSETILFLLIIGPVLEELVFRGALWKLLEGVLPSPNWVLGLTTVFFSYAHFHAWWTAPSEFRPFVLFQSGYTALLGLGCGALKLKTRSNIPPIVTHFAFNLGFYLGYLTS